MGGVRVDIRRVLLGVPLAREFRLERPKIFEEFVGNNKAGMMEGVRIRHYVLASLNSFKGRLCSGLFRGVL